ncbi:hypothetical protein [Longimicrobium sp.]|uniref:hypothetical protein n=1 Tax=Longimicrobium sp. TaxID=2029185 RepID=UPI002E346336|nr:hypothetical protein [Longimicrobium sp.]HEX6036766.1 hypothetical protein [Longimicrobium sp.]
MRTAALLVMFGMMAGCASGGSGARPVRGAAPVAWRSLVGCWRLVAPRDDGVRVAFDSTLSTASSAQGREGARDARSFREHLSNPQEYWRVTPADSVLYVVHEGLWGSYSEFTARGDSLVGRMYTFSDVPGAEPNWRPAAAVRAACPAESAGG